MRRALAAIHRSVRGALRQTPRAAWICGLVALINAACWSIITPPFEMVDEPFHFAYVQKLAETGTLPRSSDIELPEEETVAMRDLDLQEVRFHPENHPVTTRAQERTLQHDLAQPLHRSAPEGPSSPQVKGKHSSRTVYSGAAEPPLYYALQTIPYFLGSGGTLLERLELMRLLSALLAGVTAFFAYLFVREVLPGASWAWIVGGMSIALTPLLGVMSGAVNNDALLYAASAALFFLFARAFRRGLTNGLAIAIGLVIAVGLSAKPNFLGLVPGVIIGLLALSIRAAGTSRRTAYSSLALAIGIGAIPVYLDVVINSFSHYPGFAVLTTNLHQTSRGSLSSEISYVWQLYLPRLPGMSLQFPGVSTTAQWFNSSVGLYGWLDTPFPTWVDRLAVIPVVLLTVLGVRALVMLRATLRRRLVELTVYGLMGVGLLALIGAANYTARLTEESADFIQPRYLLPLLALLGSALALSARGAGRRFGPVVGAVIVMLFLAYDVFSQLQVVARFYG